MKKNSVKVLSALVAGLLAQVAYAGSITDIKVSVLPNKQRVIKFKFNKDAVEPTGFITSSPARITLDFANTDLKVKQPTLTFNDNLLNQIVTAQSEGNTRVLLGLGQEGQYNVQVKGNEVWVQLSEARSSNSAPVSAVPAARSVQTQSAYSSSVPFNIDFHKGGNNSGVVEFSSNFTGEPQVRSQSDRLVITLKNYPLPAQAQRNLDVTDFSTPVRTISVRRVGNDTQITLRNQGTWKHTITGKNGRQSIQITPTKNVTELGIGPAIIFSLYSPLANHDLETAKSIMRIFKKAYIYIGTLILFLGLCISPFVQYLIKVPPNIAYLNIFFLLFVVDTGISYFYSYKKCLLIADQKQFIPNCLSHFNS